MFPENLARTCSYDVRVELTVGFTVHDDSGPSCPVSTAGSDDIVANTLSNQRRLGCAGSGLSGKGTSRCKEGSKTKDSHHSRGCDRVGSDAREKYVCENLRSCVRQFNLEPW